MKQGHDPFMGAEAPANPPMRRETSTPPDSITEEQKEFMLRMKLLRGKYLKESLKRINLGDDVSTVRKTADWLIDEILGITARVNNMERELTPPNHSMRPQINAIEEQKQVTSEADLLRRKYKSEVLQRLQSKMDFGVIPETFSWLIDEILKITTKEEGLKIRKERQEQATNGQQEAPNWVERSRQNGFNQNHKFPPK